LQSQRQPPSSRQTTCQGPCSLLTPVGRCVGHAQRSTASDFYRNSTWRSSNSQYCLRRGFKTSFRPSEGFQACPLSFPLPQLRHSTRTQSFFEQRRAPNLYQPTKSKSCFFPAPVFGVPARLRGRLFNRLNDVVCYACWRHVFLPGSKTANLFFLHNNPSRRASCSEFVLQVAVYQASMKSLQTVE